MKVKKIYLIVFAIGIVNLSFAQNANQPRYFSLIGKTIPYDLPLQMANYQFSKAKISDFKDKLLILDFWADWCSPCRSFLIKADSLHKKFGNKLIILPITYQDSATVVRFLSSFKKVTGINSYSAINDDNLNSTFQHRLIPHEVWINAGDQTVIAITDADQVNSANIEKVLNHEPIDWVMKVDMPMINVDFNKPFLVDGNKQTNIPSNEVLLNINTSGYQFKLTKHIDSLIGGGTFPGNDIKAYNVNIQSLYAYTRISEGDDPGVINSGHMVLKVKDTTIIHEPFNGNYQMYAAWANKNTYCYELILKDSTLNGPKIARNELNKYFKKLNIEGIIEQRTVPCYVLKRTSVIDKIKSAGGAKTQIIGAYILNYKNARFADWIFKLQSYWLQMEIPIIDDSGFGNEMVDMDLVCNMENVNSINTAIAKYDLKFVKENRKESLMVIKNIK